jgi:hypothetical protein
VAKLQAPVDEECVASDQKRVDPLTHERRKGHVDFAAGAGFGDQDLQPEGASGFGCLLYRGLCTCDIGRIDQHGNPDGLWYQIVQKTQLLGHHLLVQEIDAGRIAARTGEARNQA